MPPTPADAADTQQAPDAPADGGLAILESLRRMGLVHAGEQVELEPLTGGVSSDIYRADLASGSVCVKRALPKLKVSADWRAPTERNRHEVGWMRFVASVAPNAVPRVIAADDEGLAFAMEFLPEHDHPVWKARLRDGHPDPEFAGSVGRLLASIHAASADRPDLAQAFATDSNFHAIRLEPYLVATATRHPDLEPPLSALVTTTANTRRVLVHGDVSPKNILCGPHGPVFLDAECAWFGDPAFDLAFCLNHLLLKSVWRPAHRAGFTDCLRALLAGYLAGVRWEQPTQLERRAAALLPALMLARVDGKSPVEYLRHDDNRDLVRRFACPRVAHAPSMIEPVASDWLAHLQRHPPLPED